jgi:DNA-binding PadR family transcriptional regulator
MSAIDCRDMNTGDGIHDLLPLPSATLHILLALAEGERHGYAIIQDIEARTDGELRMSAGTLYRSIARMVDQGLITEVARRRTRADDERRRYYRLTSFGEAVARAEVRRLTQCVRHAVARGLTPRVV